MTSWPPFPREIEAEPFAERLRAALDASARPLWREAHELAPCVTLGPALEQVLARAGRDGGLVLGLEDVAAALDREDAGLAATAAREGRPRAARLSRILLLADDGAERFYRGAERLARRHAGRLLVCRLDAPATALGRAALGRAVGVKAVLVQHKRLVAAVLRAIAGARPEP